MGKYTGSLGYIYASQQNLRTFSFSKSVGNYFLNNNRLGWLTRLCAAVIHAASGRSLFHAAAWPCDPVPFAVTGICVEARQQQVQDQI